MGPDSQAPPTYPREPRSTTILMGPKFDKRGRRVRDLPGRKRRSARSGERFLGGRGLLEDHLARCVGGAQRGPAPAYVADADQAEEGAGQEDPRPALVAAVLEAVAEE